jgi:outer membrane protein assembly factor BamD
MCYNANKNKGDEMITTKKVIFATSLLGALLLTGCSTKEEVEYNKSAEYWYQKMTKEIARFELEKADQTYSSLQSEHFRTSLLEEATLLLAQAHMDREEYLLANFYLDEYLKRYSTSTNRDFSRFLKIKADFMAFKNPGREQQLLLETIEEAKAYIKEYPTSPYRPVVATMLAKLLAANTVMNNKVAALYEKLDKPDGAKFYRAKNTQLWIDTLKVQEPTLPWYRRLFE